MAYINPSSGFINYSNIKNEELLNEKLSIRTNKFHSNYYNKKYFIITKYFKKMCTGTVFYNKNSNVFDYPAHCLHVDDPNKLFSQFLEVIVNSEVSRFFSNSRFLEKFYETYAKIYYSKMSSTVRNYTVESISLKSMIFPFETAFVDFINQYYDFDDAINKLTSNILYICTKRFIKFNHYNNETDRCKKCDIAFYDLLFRPNYVSKKLHKTLSIDKEFEFDGVPSYITVDDINYHELKNCIRNDDIDELHLYESDIKASSLVYTIIKRSIRYTFIAQMQQAFGWFLDTNKGKYPEIKSVISDTNLYYTQNIINIKQNVKCFENIITFCDSILSIKSKRKNIMNKDDNINSFTQYVKSIVDHMRTYNDVDMKIMNGLKKLYVTCLDKNQPQPVYDTEMYKTLKTISEYFCDRNKTSLINVQKYNFIDRWNEVIDMDSMINPINYIVANTIKEF